MWNLRCLPLPCCCSVALIVKPILQRVWKPSAVQRHARCRSAPQQPQRVERHALLSYLKMQVRSGGGTGAADEADRVALAYVLAGRCQQRAQVGVARLAAIRMI